MNMVSVMERLSHFFIVSIFLLILVSDGRAEAAVYYDVGTPTLSEIWVDPVNGDDVRSGNSRGEAFRTLTRAWEAVPASVSSTGYRINLVPGTYPCEPGPEDSNCSNYFSDRTGTYHYPLIIRASDGAGTVTIRGGLNINNVQYLYLMDLSLAGGTPLPTNNSGNNLLHVAASDYVLLRGLRLDGPSCANDGCNNLQEVLKVNQVQHLYVEDSIIGGAWHSSVDYMVVQYGHFLNNRVHTASQWCMYVKGGSAYFLVEGNEFFGCQLGFGAGQSANFAMMRSPWLHYDAYDIKFVNNILHDIPGTGMAASGGYNVLFAYNTLYGMGTSTASGYPLMAFVQAERNCTATDENPGFVSTCNAYIGLGGWGPDFDTDTTSDPLRSIPNRKVYVYNNVFYNPASQTMYSHFDVFGPITPSPGFQNVPDPSRADDNLVIRGNAIWNGPADHPLGAGDAGQGCQSGNPTCNPAQLVAENAFNTLEPQLVDPSHGNFHPVAGSNLFSLTRYSIPDFVWSDAPGSPPVPLGTTSNYMAQDLDGYTRSGSDIAGAYRATVIEPLISRLYSGGSEYPSSLVAAYSAVTGNGESILLKYGPYPSMTFDRTWSVSIRGGYGGAFRDNTALFSTLNGSVIISVGAVTMEQIAIQ